MNKHTPLKFGGSILERAAEVYDFRNNLRGPAPPESPAREEGVSRAQAAEEAAAPAPVPPADPASEAPRRKQPIIMSEVEVTIGKPETAPEMPSDDFMTAAPEPQPRPAQAPARRAKVNQKALRAGGFILPNAPVTGLAEEYRIIKRQLLEAVSGRTGIAEDKRQTILVCSAAPDEGKTFSAMNLALSMASEEDLDVLLVDGDFNKPEILSTLGIEGGPGLVDAIENPDVDPNSLVVQTDIDRLSVLPAGRQVNNIPELLASERTRQVLAALTEGRPNRVVIFDSPPTLMASPASVLATKVGQVMLVVRADKTTEANLREAVGLLSGCEHVSLMLNGAGFAATGRRFGSYYGYGK